MTVTASPDDVPPPGYNTGLGRGAGLLAQIASIQALVTAAKNPAAQDSLVRLLTQLQAEAVDYFMASYWVSADSILAQMTNMMVLPKKGDLYVKTTQAAIATRLVQVNALIAAGTPVSPQDGNYPQYSVAYPPPISGYPLTEPDVYWYGLQMQLVDYCMNQAILPAALILATMTGVQTYPTNRYVSNYTTYQPYLSSDAFA